MSNFTIGEAWSQAVAFVKANLRMLAITLGAGVLISALLQYFLVGGDQMAQMAQLQSALRTGDLSQLAGAGAATGGVMMLVGLAAGIVQSTAEFAAIRMGLAPGEEPASAVTYGLVAAVLTLLAFFVIGLVAAIIVIVPLALLMGGMGAAGGGVGSLGVLSIFLGLMLLVVILYLAARLCVFRPTMAAARSTNPIFGLKQSWDLTRDSAWWIVLYLLLLGVVGSILGAIIGGIVGAVGAALGGFGAMLLMSIFVSVPFAVLGAGVVVGIYRTLAPSTDASVFA